MFGITIFHGISVTELTKGHVLWYNLGNSSM